MSGKRTLSEPVFDLFKTHAWVRTSLDTRKNNELDLTDFAIFRAAFTGPNDPDD